MEFFSSQLGRLLYRHTCIQCFNVLQFCCVLIFHQLWPMSMTYIHVWGAVQSFCEICCGQLWVWHMICGQTCDGLYHFVFYLINSGLPYGSHTIKPALARHTGVQVSLVPAKVIQPTGVHGLCFGSLVFQVRSLYVPWYLVHFQGSISGSP